jgi:excisionase family DNA binding protein
VDALTAKASHAIDNTTNAAVQAVTGRLVSAREVSSDAYARPAYLHTARRAERRAGPRTLAALHTRASRQTSDQEQPHVPSPARRTTSGRPLADGSYAPQREAKRPPSEQITFLTVADVAGIMRVSTMTVSRLVSSGHLPAVRVGRHFRVPQASVYAYLREWDPAHVDGR